MFTCRGGFKYQPHITHNRADVTDPNPVISVDGNTVTGVAEGSSSLEVGGAVINITVSDPVVPVVIGLLNYSSEMKPVMGVAKGGRLVGLAVMTSYTSIQYNPDGNTSYQVFCNPDTSSDVVVASSRTFSCATNGRSGQYSWRLWDYVDKRIYPGYSVVNTYTMSGPGSVPDGRFFLTGLDDLTEPCAIIFKYGGSSLLAFTPIPYDSVVTPCSPVQFRGYTNAIESTITGYYKFI